ncbi:MAG: hypothetical protein UIM53_09005, partial [Acutalibacteraceae bacterium]|nr:hypothetical protein [Acutalibacteraceae bacterium]
YLQRDWNLFKNLDFGVIWSSFGCFVKHKSAKITSFKSSVSDTNPTAQPSASELQMPVTNKIYSSGPAQFGVLHPLNSTVQGLSFIRRSDVLFASVSVVGAVP